MTIYGNSELELVAIRRELSSLVLGKKPRKNVFQTRCTVNGKVCAFIVDGRCFGNMASTTLVEKMGLPTTPRLKSYKLKWLNEVGYVRIDKQVAVSFSIGKSYKDKVLCDVVPMESCHVLLGHPWGASRRVSHDKVENTYEFNWGKRLIRLRPLSIQCTVPSVMTPCEPPPPPPPPLVLVPLLLPIVEPNEDVIDHGADLTSYDGDCLDITVKEEIIDLRAVVDSALCLCFSMNLVDLVTCFISFALVFT